MIKYTITTRMMITTSRRIGANTHHQLIEITPKSFRMRRMRKMTVIHPTPLLLELLLIIYFFKG